MPEIILTVIKGKEPGKTFTVAQPMMAGRSPKVPIFLDDSKASRQHAQFRPSANGGLEIEDLGSVNGTQLNGKVFKGIHALYDGDTITIGDTVLGVKAPHLKPPVVDALAAAETQRIPAIKIDEPPKSKAPSSPANAKLASAVAAVPASSSAAPKPSGASDKLKKTSASTAEGAKKPAAVSVKKSTADTRSSADDMQLRTRGKDVLTTQKPRTLVPNLGLLSEDWSSQTFGRQVLIVLVMVALAVAMASMGWAIFGGCSNDLPRPTPSDVQPPSK